MRPKWGPRYDSRYELRHVNEPAAARFDPALGAWILSTYADVSAALRDPRLSLSASVDVSRQAKEAFREAAGRALSPQRVADWRVAVERSAVRRAQALALDEPVDLVTAFAAPFSAEVAAIVSGATVSECARLSAPAREIFRAAAFATRSDAQPHTHHAVATLSRALPGPDAAIAVQSFVALSQTLPCVLAGVWLALIDAADLMNQLRRTPGLLTRAVDELLRLTGTSRAVFRHAAADTRIGAAHIRSGERVILMIAAANRDSAQFADPSRLDLSRGAAGHLALGIGMHSCLGASVVRMTVACATTALFDATTSVELAGPVEWLDGFAIRAPATLPVVLRLVHGAR